MAKDFNQLHIVENYDQHIRKLIPGYELIHQQIQVLLKLKLKDDAKIVIVGCGTGHELIQLAKAFPYFQFTALDIAEHMLEKAKINVKNQNLSHQIHFIHADTTVLNQFEHQFDAALSILVAHFVPKESKTSFFKDIYHALKPNGLCIHVDLMQFDQENGAEYLQQLAELTGLHPKQAQLMKTTFDEDFALITIDEMKKIYQKVGFKQQDIFFKAFNYCGLIACKSI